MFLSSIFFLRENSSHSEPSKRIMVKMRSDFPYRLVELENEVSFGLRDFLHSCFLNRASSDNSDCVPRLARLLTLSSICNDIKYIKLVSR